MSFHEDAIRRDHITDIHRIALVQSGTVACSPMLNIVHTTPTGLATLLDE
jgi:hypothetical protein